MYLQMWMLFLWALSLTDCLCGAILAEDTAILREDDFDPPNRQNDKFSNEAYPYVKGNGNNIYDDRYAEFSPRCTERLENALELIRRRQVAKQKTLHLNGYSLHQQLRSAPYDMYVTDMRVRLPSSSSWVRVDRCRFDPRNTSLETRLLFNDLTISGRVNLFNGDDIQRQEGHALDTDNSCNMILRLRRAGIGFYTEPIRRERGHFNVRTDSHFLEPGFISVYAYECEPTKFRAYSKDLREEEEDELSREMEDIFLKGIRSLLTSYMQKELQPAIKETLMKNMGYTVSYG
ncbi:uncharacterized protein LOC123322820 isoform X1 [Coccinella septempunctata]|uniref:uncharacterized protein LOC123322820 isoform X1 n=1 Tax=Coccinella septempunctata TaxID=41139 RepID=UPI001D095E63|nr:uncharacterized protein LOC123322820 isoform X1 [Coccinella septempunctata]XP_044766782.1 uncharacterized protein LOC123322820 isoform X1 [Coccinella septempunctata]